MIVKFELIAGNVISYTVELEKNCYDSKKKNFSPYVIASLSLWKLDSAIRYIHSILYYSLSKKKKKKGKKFISKKYHLFPFVNFTFDRI